MLGYYEDEAATRKTLVERWLYTGDLGRVDDDGNLYLVGRSKEIIVDTNGKNVYPDELEELYEDSPYVKELSIVGLPDGDRRKGRVSRRRRRRIRHLAFTRGVASSRRRALPRSLRFPALLQTRQGDALHRHRIAAHCDAQSKTARSGPDHGSAGTEPKSPAGKRQRERLRTQMSVWLMGIVAGVANRPRAEVSIDSRLSDLGFDSLMFVELATSIESAGGAISAPERFNEVQDVRELTTVVSRRGGASVKQEVRLDEKDKDDEIHVPSFVRTAGNKAGDFLQRFLYDQFLKTYYEGRSNIPPHTNFIVAANHCSHLDMGLTKMALGEAGKDMVALAAADYFFDTKYKRAVMENFTNLVPMERTGSLRQSLRHARSFLAQGYNALIFPEGTRSMTGILADFKPVVGYLALHANVGILPMYLDGTYQAMPKGTTIIKNRNIGARIGRFLSFEELEEMTKGMARAEAYRLIAARVRHEVVNLRDGTRDSFDPKALRKLWRSERRAAQLTVNEEEAMSAV